MLVNDDGLGDDRDARRAAAISRTHQSRSAAAEVRRTSNGKSTSSSRRQARLYVGTNAVMLFPRSADCVRESRTSLRRLAVDVASTRVHDGPCGCDGTVLDCCNERSGPAWPGQAVVVEQEHEVRSSFSHSGIPRRRRSRGRCSDEPRAACAPDDGRDALRRNAIRHRPRAPRTHRSLPVAAKCIQARSERVRAVTRRHDDREARPGRHEPTRALQSRDGGKGRGEA